MIFGNALLFRRSSRAKNRVWRPGLPGRHKAFIQAAKNTNVINHLRSIGGNLSNL
jgi:hypothetical protein